MKRSESKVRCCCCKTIVAITTRFTYNDILCLSCYFDKELIEDDE